MAQPGGGLILTEQCWKLPGHAPADELNKKPATNEKVLEECARSWTGAGRPPRSTSILGWTGARRREHGELKRKVNRLRTAFVRGTAAVPRPGAPRQGAHLRAAVGADAQGDRERHVPAGHLQGQDARQGQGQRRQSQSAGASWSRQLRHRRGGRGQRAVLAHRGEALCATSGQGSTACRWRR